VPVVVAAAKDAADGFQPTNPAIVRHKVEAKGPNGGVVDHWRTWVVYQTGSCATAVPGGWEINKAAELKAVVLDSLVKPKEEKVATTEGWKGLPVFALPKAKDFAGSSKVCQGFPVVMQDAAALAKGEVAWVSWLEADLGASEPSGCLKGKAMGGRVRVAALGASGVTALAEDACPTLGSASPLFMTPAFVVKDPVSAAKDAVAERPWMTVRAFGGSLVEAFGNLQVHGSPAVPEDPKKVGYGDDYSRVHPVLVDTQKVGASRYWALAVTKKPELWAKPIGDDGGADVTAETWATAAKELAGVTAVCGIDAVWNPKAQEVGVVLVVRKDGKSAVWLVRKGSGAAVVSEVKKDDVPSTSCEDGWNAVRIGASSTGDFVVVWRSQSAGGVTGPGYWALLTGGTTAKSGVLPVSAVTATDDGTSALAWRGLGDVSESGGGVMVNALESLSDKKRTVQVYSWKP
jgi:hypothetical protein